VELTQREARILVNLLRDSIYHASKHQGVVFFLSYAHELTVINGIIRRLEECAGDEE